MSYYSPRHAAQRRFREQLVCFADEMRVGLLCVWGVRGVKVVQRLQSYLFLVVDMEWAD